MTRILFVHGTGVRREGFDHVFQRFSTGIHSIRPEYAVDPCLWGESIGARLLAAGESIPQARGVRSGTTAVSLDHPAPCAAQPIEEAIWTALELDSFIELSELGRFSGPMKFDTSWRVDDVASRLTNAVSTDIGVVTPLQSAGLEQVIDKSLDVLLGSPACQQALANSSVDIADKIAPLSRALVAIAMKQLDAQLEFQAPIDGVHRDQVVSAFVDRLGGDSRGIGSSILGSALRVLLEAGLLSPIEKNRAALVPRVAPAMGDVLKYLSRGHELRAHLQSAISETDEDVVVMAHSLGGIAAVDLLVTEKIDQVVGLITVGTQVGLLYELDALPSLQFGEPLPEFFPRWDTIIDRRDLLAYSSQGVFPAFATDHYIDNRSPFPRNHSAYFQNSKFYSILDQVLP